MDSQKKEAAQSKKAAFRIVQASLYFWGVVFIVVAILLFFSPELAKKTIGLDELTTQILAGGLFVAGLADFLVGKIIFGKSERV